MNIKPYLQAITNCETMRFIPKESEVDSVKEYVFVCPECGTEIRVKTELEMDCEFPCVCGGTADLEE